MEKVKKDSSHFSNHYQSKKYSTIEIKGEIRGRPDIIIQPFYLNLKITSKLFFLSREVIEKLIMQNLSYIPELKEFTISLDSMLEGLALVDIEKSR